MTVQKIKNILKYALCSVCSMKFEQLCFSRQRDWFAVERQRHKGLHLEKC